ncbi:MAG: DUF4360 domain-containing protein [Oligoflexia bacterium]|nr:DUF4360 domain-containing protein [Oligoflexia bacterium]
MKWNLNWNLKTKIFKLGIVGALLIGAAFTYAGNNQGNHHKKNFVTPIFGTPNAAGTACKGGVINYEYYVEEGKLIFSLEGYQAAAGGMTGKRIDRKTCNIAIPVSLPEKVSIGLAMKQLNGWAQMPSGGSAKLRTETFFAGESGVVVERDFNGSESNNDNGGWDEENQTLWSPCGITNNLRINTSLLVKTNRALEYAIAEFGPTIDLEIKFRSCE